MIRRDPRESRARNIEAQHAEVLARDNIPTAVHYPKPLHLQPAYAGFGGGVDSMPVSETLADRVLSLPIHPDLDTATVDYIADRLIDAAGG